MPPERFDLANFSPSEAAFTGFRIVREHPKAILGWAILQFILSITTTVTLVFFAGPFMGRLQSNPFQANTDPAAAMALVQHLLPAYGVMLTIMLLVYPVLYAAMNRAVLRPQDDRFGYLRIGADELRQLGLMLLLGAVGLAVYIAVVVLAVIVIAVISLSLGTAGGGVVRGLSFLIVFLGLFCAVAFVGVRLSLASALTFATRRVNLFGSWAMTRGRTLPIFGTFCLSVAISLVVLILGMVVIAAVMSVMSGGVAGLASVFTPNMSSLAVFLTPKELVYLALAAILNALVLPLMLTPPAAIYQSLATDYGHPGGSQPPVHDVFA